MLRLSPERAFVLHLDERAQPPRRVLGRIEHVTSGRIARITSLRGLTTFLRDVLRDVDIHGPPPRDRLETTAVHQRNLNQEKGVSHEEE